MNAAREMVEKMARLVPQHKVFALLLRHGQEFTQRRRPRHVRRGPMGCCYSNAGKIVLRDGRYRYAEGYAMRPGLIPLPHGWLVDAGGFAIDPTWEDDGTVFFGVVFTKEEHRRIIKASTHFGVFEYPGRCGVRELQKRAA